MYGSRGGFTSVGRFGWFLGGCLLAGCLRSAPVVERSIVLAHPDGWRPALGSPAPVREHNAVRFDCPFPDNADRHIWDTEPMAISHDGMSGLEFVYTLLHSEAFRGLTWYVRSGDGWYSAPLPVGEGIQRVWIPLSAFETSGVTAGWQAVDAYRLSPWTARRGAGAVRLHDVRARRAEVGVVMPGEWSSPDLRERAFGRRSADQWIHDLYALDVPAVRLEETELSTASLDSLRVLVLPYNPAPNPAMIKALEAFTRRGGCLIACYNGHQALAALVGVETGRWLSSEPPGRFHRMAFTQDNAWRGPAMVFQTTTPHVLTMQPGSSGAQTLAYWEDAAGRRQPEAALVVSRRGAWFSYLLGTDDDVARLRMLAFLLDRFLPSTALSGARRKIESTAQQMDMPFEDFIQSMPDAGALAAAHGRAYAALDTGDAARAWDEASEFAGAMDRATALRWVWPEGARLGIWDHSGRGLHSGDWHSTMGELAQAGFSDVFVYISRTAPRPDQAAAAGKAYHLGVHAWHICYSVEGIGVEQIRAYERQGRLQHAATGETAYWLCPTLPENRREEQERILRLAATPHLAGIHLDYVRFPDENHCFCPACRAAFEKEIGKRISHWPHDVTNGEWKRVFLDWRAEQISRLVEEVSLAVRATYPLLRISAAVWPDVDTMKDRLGQDWPRWLREGWVDFVVPMSYTESVGELIAWTRRHAALPGAEGRIWAGLGVTSSHTRLTPMQTLLQTHSALEAAAAGVVVFDLNTTVRSTIFPLFQRIRKGEHHD